MAATPLCTVVYRSRARRRTSFVALAPLLLTSVMQVGKQSENASCPLRALRTTSVSTGTVGGYSAWIRRAGPASYSLWSGVWFSTIRAVTAGLAVACLPWWTLPAAAALAVGWKTRVAAVSLL